MTSRIALDIRMWKHSGIGSYLRGLVNGFSQLQPQPRITFLGPRALTKEAASLSPLWSRSKFNPPVYSLWEQLIPAQPRPHWALYHAPHYNFPLRWPDDRPLVVSIHDLIHLDYGSSLKRFYQSCFLQQLQTRNPHHLRIIAGSEATRSRLLEAAPHLPTEIIRLIPYGISSAYFAQQANPQTLASWRVRWSLPDDYLLMVGIALPHKNHEFILRALLPLYRQGQFRYPLVLCGIGHEGAQKYRAIIDKLAPDAPVHLLPHLPQQDMGNLYASAFALILPSLIEGFGLPIVEAQAMGTPVLASNRPAPREAGGEAALYFDPENQDSFISALQRLIQESALRSRLITLGRQHAQKFQWHLAAVRTAKVYRELAGESVFQDFENTPQALDKKAQGQRSATLGKDTPQDTTPKGLYKNPAHRVAFIHDWLNGKRGGERVLEDLCAIWPLADIHTLFYEPHRVSETINNQPVFPSILRRLPRTRHYYRNLLPFFPWAVRKMDLSEYDLVISISHCAAKAAPVPAGVPHLCYCLTPARYLYDQAQAYFAGRRNLLAPVRQHILERLRRWDQETAKQVTHFVAISHFVADRIQRFYGREADVVYPAVDTYFYTPPSPANQQREDFFITVCSAVPYKRLDLTVQAFNTLKWPLIVVGRGPGLADLQRMANSNITFRPWVGQLELRDLYRKARGFVFTAEEDFGIAPIEAQACGCPAIALRRGGTAETVLHNESGLLFPEQTLESLMEALRSFNPADFSPEAIRANAERFNPVRFRNEFLEAIQKIT